MDQQRTEISSIGEFGLIDRIAAITEHTGSPDPEMKQAVLEGIGDDAAVYRPTPGMLQILTTDAYVEGIHFDLTFTSLRHLGWKTVAASISDIAAMGGKARCIVIALSLPAKISVEMMEEFYSGAMAACRKYGCMPVGGDTTASTGNMMITVTATGEAPDGKIRTRRGARPGEYLCVSGHLGASIAGLRVLQREKERYLAAGERNSFRPALDAYAPALEKHLMPKPRFDISDLLVNRVRCGALIDISDGLASEVHHLCRASGTGAAVYEHNIPVEGFTMRIAQEFGTTSTEFALYGGEEYELLFSIADEEFGRLETFTQDVTVIGRVTDASKGVILVRENEEETPLPDKGWDHFR